MRRSRLFALGAGLLLISFLLWGNTRSQNPGDAVFTVSKSMDAGEVKEKIATQEFTKNLKWFGLALMLHGGYSAIDPGGYRIPAKIGSWQLAGILTGEPDLKWVTIAEGLRKEQVAERLQEGLGWDDAKRQRFLDLSITEQTPYDLSEGFFFPDTYLIPKDEDEQKVFRRFVNHFNEVFDPLLPALKRANIKSDTAVKLASILQREAGGRSDMPLIAGILWKRLEIGMKLEVDATLQYLRGDEGKGYWAVIDPEVKHVDSPYNTYMYKGLPPGPISNPGLDALKAVIVPQETECLFYLHAPDRTIHCGKTYEEHLANIDKYLR